MFGFQLQIHSLILPHPFAEATRHTEGSYTYVASVTEPCDVTHPWGSAPAVTPGSGAQTRSTTLTVLFIQTANEDVNYELDLPDRSSSSCSHSDVFHSSLNFGERGTARTNRRRPVLIDEFTYYPGVTSILLYLRWLRQCDRP